MFSRECDYNKNLNNGFQIALMLPKLHFMPKTQAGFTLIELMITIVVLGVLSAIALPSYQSYIQKAQIRTAQTDLVALSLVFENYYQRNLSYPDQDYSQTTELVSAFTEWAPSKTEPFEFSSTQGEQGKGFTITATAQANSPLKGCVIRLTHTNSREISNCKSISSW